MSADKGARAWPRRPNGERGCAAKIGRLKVPSVPAAERERVDATVIAGVLGSGTKNRSEGFSVNFRCDKSA